MVAIFADVSYSRHEWSRPVCRQRWPASPAGAAPARLQEREIHHTLGGNGRFKKFGKGLGSAAPEGGYAWYAGI